MSTSEEGRVVSIHLNVGHRQPMRPVAGASFVEGTGIEGDRHSTPRVERHGYQVLLVESETLEARGLAPGTIRENVTTAGIGLASLSAGQRLKLGDQVVLEISKPCAPCSRMEEIRPGLQEDLEGRRGMLAAVVRSGAVNVGDAVRLAESAPVP